MSTGPISFQSSILPVFVGTNQGDPTHEGTAFLLRANGNLFLISAAHVLERFEAGEIWIPVNGVLQNLTGRICRCQENQSSTDNIDVAVVLVDAPLAGALMPTTVFCPAMIKLNPPCGPDYEFTFCGYPGEAIRLKQGSISRTLHLYTSLGIDRSKYLRVGASHMSHVAIDISSKVRDRYGKKIWLPRSKGLKGLSGGPVLALTDGSWLPAMPTARVVGVAIKQRFDQSLILATQARYICEAIFKLAPGLKKNFGTSSERILCAREVKRTA